MPPGIRGINIVPGPLQSENFSARTVFEPRLGPRPGVIPEPWIDRKRGKDASARFGKYSAALSMCTGLAIVALVVAYDPSQFRNLMAIIPSSIESFIHEKPRLLAEAQNGSANEPLPLGVTVEHASDGEIVMIEGLPEGADLSLGNRSNGISWSIPVADLEQTYVGAPTNFVGVIETTVTLRSASGKLLDRQALHFEWRASKGAPSDQPPRETTNYETASPGVADATPGRQHLRARPLSRSRHWPRRRILLDAHRAARLLRRNEAPGQRQCTRNGQAQCSPLTHIQR
jgi:hypothetical protein